MNVYTLLKQHYKSKVVNISACELGRYLSTNLIEP
jgi:hypothetical protein